MRSAGTPASIIAASSRGASAAVMATTTSPFAAATSAPSADSWTRRDGYETTTVSAPRAASSAVSAPASSAP